jgi:hypothetical protein
MAAAVPVWVVVKAVVAASVTVTDVAFLVCGFVSLTVTWLPDTAVTCPEAAPNEPLPNDRPAGGLNVPVGLVPPVPVPPGPPPNPPVRPPNPPRSHAPDTGWVIDTVVAVIGSPKGVDDLEVEVGLPNAEMQEPTVTADAVVVVIWWMVVEDV